MAVLRIVCSIKFNHLPHTLLHVYKSYIMYLSVILNIVIAVIVSDAFNCSQKFLFCGQNDFP